MKMDKSCKRSRKLYTLNPESCTHHVHASLVPIANVNDRELPEITPAAFLARACL